jgi:copper homeostasis protein (lipoprotein)
MLLAVLGCTGAVAGTIEGTAAYRERIVLPADAVFEAELQDISRADAPATVLGRSSSDPAGRPPFRFEIAYDDAAMQPGRRYSLRATVRHQGRLLFTTDRIYAVPPAGQGPLHLQLVSVGGSQDKGTTAEGVGVLPASYEGELPGAGNPIVWHLDLLPENRYQLRMTHVGQPEPNRFDDIGRWMREPDTGRILLRGGREAPVFLMPVEGGAMLRKLDLEGRFIESGHNDRLTRLTEPALIEPRLTMRGMFSHVREAASITLCLNGQRLPVAMGGDYRALESAYLKGGAAPGQPLLASLEGRITRRPSMEASRGPRAELVVERLIGVWPRETCGNTLADSALRGTYWKLVRLGEDPVVVPEKQREAHLVLATDELRVAGSGGCNRLFGGFELDGDRLRFGRLGTTRMSCPDGMAQERRFIEAMEQAARYRILGSHLELLDASGAVRARFEAVWLR